MADSPVCAQNTWLGAWDTQVGLSYHRCHMTDLMGPRVRLLYSAMAVVTLPGTSPCRTHKGVQPVCPAIYSPILDHFCRSYC